jgi:hypothetical protein
MSDRLAEIAIDPGDGRDSRARGICVVEIRAARQSREAGQGRPNDRADLWEGLAMANAARLWSAQGALPVTDRLVRIRYINNDFRDGRNPG